ncbi:hypothetical protein ACW5W6_21520, partial [Aeromonas mytilicola]
KSGAARETRAGAERGCLKQLCATTILKNAEHMGDSVYPQWRCHTYYFFVNKSDGYVQSAMRISRVLRRMMDFHMGD